MEHGINAAILYANISFWVAKNEADKKHYHDGRYWTYSSLDAFAKLFPYLTVRQIQLALKKLVDAGLVTKGCYSDDRRDRTLWYALGEAKSEDDQPDGAADAAVPDGEKHTDPDDPDTDESEKHILHSRKMHLTSDLTSASNAHDTDVKSNNNNIYNNIIQTDSKHTDIKHSMAASPREGFVPPTVAEVAEYCASRGNGIDADEFVDFYTSKGWFVGRNKMRDWRAAVRTWEKSRRERASPASTPAYQRKPAGDEFLDYLNAELASAGTEDGHDAY